MQVILLEKVENLGSIGSVVVVKNGYGRNFLLPRKKALRATKHNLEVFGRRRLEIEEQNEVKKKQAEGMLDQLVGLTVVLYRQAGEDNRLYGSVTARDIASAICDMSDAVVSHEHIELTGKFKELGNYQVSVTLHPEVKVNITAHIVRGDLAASEAEVLTAEAAV